MRRLASGKQDSIKVLPGFENENETGFDYSHSVPSTATDHRGIQHCYCRKRKGCWSAKMPQSGPVGFGKLGLPKPGS